MKKKQIMIRLFLVASLLLCSCDAPTSGDGGSWSGTKLTGAPLYETRGNAVAVDASGNVVMAGMIESEQKNAPNIQLDGQWIMGVRSMYVTKYSPGGSKRWTRVLGIYDGYAIAFGVATDAEGNVYVAGHTQCDKGGSTALDYGLDGQKCLDDTYPADDVATLFLTKYSASGEKQWTRLQGAGTDNEDDVRAYAVAVDEYGYVYVCGRTEGALNVPTGITAPTMTGSMDIFLSKFDSDGILQWTKMAGTDGATSEAFSVAVSNNAEYIFVTGYTDGDLWGTINNSDDNAMIIGYAANNASTDFDGGTLIDTALGGSIEGTGIAASYDEDESTQYVFVVGSSTGGYNLGSSVDPIGISDGFFARYTFDGGLTVDADADNPDSTGLANKYIYFTGVAAASNHTYAYVSGYANCNVTAQLSGVCDSLIMQFPYNSATNDLLGSLGDFTYGNAIATNSSNGVYVAGDAHGSILDGSYVNGNIDAFITKYSINIDGGVVHY
jgi:hypothetical protein